MHEIAGQHKDTEDPTTERDNKNIKMLNGFLEPQFNRQKFGVMKCVIHSKKYLGPLHSNTCAALRNFVNEPVEEAEYPFPFFPFSNISFASCVVCYL
jgi:hypothetical protein